MRMGDRIILSGIYIEGGVIEDWGTGWILPRHGCECQDELTGPGDLPSVT